MRFSLMLAAASIAAATPAPGATGQQIFSRCAACHLPTGAGVPGAYPPLRGDVRALARKADGRRYLVHVVIRGLSGPITVEGKPYRGTMPMQGGLDDEAVAAVLTYLTGTLATGSGPAPTPFTAAEVKRVREGAAAMSGADVARSQPRP
ncbi:MAG: cytochrome c [Sphingomonadales bacterium]|nr:cytochrome c [Sphingomonadales bacterium]